MIVSNDDYETIKDKINVVEFPWFDLTKQHIVLSFGKRIHRITYKKGYKIRDSYIGKADFCDEFEGGIVYVYSSEKVKCVRDLRMGSDSL